MQLPRLAGALAAALAACLLALLPGGRAQADSAWQTGKLGQLGFGTTYDEAGAACGYGPLPADDWPFGGLAAVDPLASPFAAGVQQGCGVCLEVTCADAAACRGAAARSFVVQVVDHCSGCGADAVYLSPAAYARLGASAGIGEVAGRFRRVNCNPPGPLEVHVGQYRGSEGGWLRLALKSAAGSGDIASVSLTSSQNPDGWQALQRAFGASWQLSSLPAPPFDIMAVDSTGQAVMARNVLTQAGATGDFPTTVQFQPSPALAAAPTSAAPPAQALPLPQPAIAPSTSLQPLSAATAPAAGLSRLLQDGSAQATLLVPVSSALGAEIDARPLRNESTLAQLVLNAPELVSPLVGYHVLPGLWPAAALAPGSRIDTSDTIDKVNRLQITAQGPTALQGIGSSARILQGDLAACGPLVVHIVDQVLLPFRFDQAAIDAVTGTTAPQVLAAQAAQEAALAAQEAVQPAGK